MSRRLAITKRVDLSDLAEGWDGCYALVAPASYDEATELAETDIATLTQAQVSAINFKFAKDHFVSGKVMVLNDDNQPELGEMQVDDIGISAELINRINNAVLGATPDPKASTTATESSATETDSIEQ